MVKKTNTDKFTKRDTGVVAIVGISGMAIVGLLTGHDGMLLTSAMTMCAGIAGYTAAVKTVKK